MTMKCFLFLAVAAGCLPVLIIKTRPAKVPYDTLFTELAAVQEEIVAVHNTLRRGVSPPASNMLKMVVWATSYLIGCGVSSCHKGIHYLYICHYCHEGNDPEKKNVPYNKGSPCGDCPNNCEDKLCTNPCIYYDEYNNCNTQTQHLGCKHLSVQRLCKASCMCQTEIK
ncbi:CRISP1 [Cervus elaphus hippelaphus]|uniref:CRISP1 n=1 Tax=Cervus elaphus hippelaphus TaxID=46360 RepID=A0A212D5D1_CEREH|nr:CRISP1 [Cervus elaphus hippelaphus]